ncbi:MAG: hypothetical protein LBV80_09985 [Deltaproteobacteria bacterium]|jgi:hypothetical protein|nr:hypothetical protein [Deltaproteobacteria bacterium]
MPKNRTELFGQLVYAPEISYEDLLPLEEKLIAAVSEKLEAAKAKFVNFESEGDRTFFQCVFNEFGEEFFASLAAQIKKDMDARCECKLFFVDKELVAAYFYAINKGKLKVGKMPLPAAGPIDRALRGEQEK